ncbi:MAG: peptide chain release factor N(5)-glutamine methyltransferase [bacterium]
MSKIWKVLEVLNWTTDYLSQKGFENARLNAEYLLTTSLELSRVDLYLNYDRPLTTAELGRFKKLLNRRLQHEPLQYISGRTEFMSLPFRVEPSVLIPRPETEVLVEKVLAVCRERFTEKSTVSILDVGTGSGCIAVSLAKYLNNAEIKAIDISEAALNTAKENAALNGVSNQIKFYQRDFLKIPSPERQAVARFDVIVSNPPYISNTDFEKLPDEVKKYEPHVALGDCSTGLIFYHKIAKVSLGILLPDGIVAVEIGLDQAQPVREIFLSNGFSEVEIFKDLTGIERVLVCSKKYSTQPRKSNVKGGHR